MPYSITEPTLIPHDSYNEHLIVIKSRGIFKIEQTTEIQGIAKVTCLKAWCEPEVYPSTAGGKIYPDPWWDNKSTSSGVNVVYDSYSDRVFFHCYYVNYDLDEILTKVHKLNIRTGVVEGVTIISPSGGIINGITGMLVSQNRIFLKSSGASGVNNMFELVVINKATMQVITTIPYNITTTPFSTMLEAMSDTELLIGGTSSGTIHYVTIDEGASSATTVRSFTPTGNITNQYKAYIKPLQKLFVVSPGTRNDGQYVGQLWDPLTGTVSDVGLLATGKAAGDILTVITPSASESHEKRIEYTEIDGHNVLIPCTFYRAANNATTSGVIEVNTQTGEIKYFGFYIYSTYGNVGTVTRLLYPNFNNNGDTITNNVSRVVDSFMYGNNNTVVAYAHYGTAYGILSYQTMSRSLIRLLEWNRSGVRTALQFDHYCDATRDILRYGSNMDVVAQPVGIWENTFHRAIKIPAIAPYGPGMIFNSAPPSAISVPRNGDRYLSPPLNIPRDQVAWLAIEHDGVSDVRVTYDATEDRSNVSVDPNYGNGMSFLAQITIWTPDGKSVSTSGSSGQVVSANDWENFFATLPAAYPAGTYYLALIPSSMYMISGLYSDHEFMASAAGVRGDTNLCVRFEHLAPTYNQVLPPQAPSLAPLSTQRFYDGAFWKYFFNEMLSEQTPLGWSVGVTYYFRVLTNPLNRKLEPFTLVSFADDGTKTLGDLLASIETQLPGFSAFITPRGELFLSRPSSTFAVLDGQHGSDVTTRLWIDAMAGSTAVNSWPQEAFGVPCALSLTPNLSPPIASGTIPYSAVNTNNATVNTVDTVLSLTAGQTLLFGTEVLLGTSSVVGEDDTYIKIKNSVGTVVAFNDDWNTYLSYLSYEVPTSGDYTLCIGGFANSLVTGVAAWQIYAA